MPPVALTLRSTWISLASWVLSWLALAGRQLHENKASRLFQSHCSRCRIGICHMHKTSPLVSSPHESTWVHSQEASSSRGFWRRGLGPASPAVPPRLGGAGSANVGVPCPERGLRGALRGGPPFRFLGLGERRQGKNQSVWFRQRNGPSLF